MVSASNGEAGDRLGRSVAVSGDGQTVAFGAWDEASSATGINGDETDNSAAGTGAVYVFRRNGFDWTQEAYIKPINANAGAHFAASVALSGDGNVLAVGADLEDTTAANSGAAYIYRRNAGVWSTEAALKASNPDATDHFGGAIALSRDGATLAVGAADEDSAGIETDNSALSAGAVYIFTFAGSWTQQAYIKPSNINAGDLFGTSVALSVDGSVLAVGATAETAGAGAAYVFTRSGTSWMQSAYIKASNAEANDSFGDSVALSDDGGTLAVAAVFESSAGRGIDADQTDNSAGNSGAVYVFTNTGTWTQQVYIKSSNSDASDAFGIWIALSSDGSTLAVSANGEDSAATGLDGDQLDNSASGAGAAYVLTRSGTLWSQRTYVKATDTAAGARFGVRLGLSGAGDVLAVGADFARAQIGSGYIY